MGENQQETITQGKEHKADQAMLHEGNTGYLKCNTQTKGSVVLGLTTTDLQGVGSLKVEF